MYTGHRGFPTTDELSLGLDLESECTATLLIFRRFLCPRKKMVSKQQSGKGSAMFVQCSHENKWPEVSLSEALGVSHAKPASGLLQCLD